MNNLPAIERRRLLFVCPIFELGLSQSISRIKCPADKMLRTIKLIRACVVKCVHYRLYWCPCHCSITQTTIINNCTDSEDDKKMTYWRLGRSRECEYICRRLHGTASRETDTRDSCPSPDLQPPSWRRCGSSRRPGHERVRLLLETPPSSYLKTINQPIYSVHFTQ